MLVEGSLTSFASGLVGIWMGVGRVDRLGAGNIGGTFGVVDSRRGCIVGEAVTGDTGTDLLVVPCLNALPLGLLSCSEVLFCVLIASFNVREESSRETDGRIGIGLTMCL